jgi:prepilin-type N-terminal cleavage/methylation domain-containing protein
MLRLEKLLYKKIFCGTSRGFTLVEVVIAIVVLGMMVAAIPTSMIVISNAQFRQNESRIGENIARSQFEYIKAQPYIWGNETSINDQTGKHERVSYDSIDLTGELESYGIRVLAEPIDPVTRERLRDIYGEAYDGQDGGVQEIEITVFGWRNDEEGDARYIFRIINYKVAREFEISGYTVER